MKIFSYIILSIVLFTSCKKRDQYLPPDFNYPIPPFPITENVNVGAYFYNYATADWAKKFTNTPVLGQYNALTASVMLQQRQWADAGGIDYFIFNWNGSATGDPLLNSFITGRNEKVKMVINYNTAHLSVTNASPLTGAKLTTMINELKTLAAAHFNKDYYFSINSQPVILITPLNLSAGALTSIDYTAVMPQVRSALTAVGVNIYVIGEITSGWLPPQRYRTAIKTMDAVDLSNWAPDTYERYYFINSFSDQNWKNWTDSTTTWNVDYVPCIMPAYNDKVMTPTSKLYDVARTPEAYTDYCNVAKRNMSKKRLVIINSWNNFQFGTTLEPATEYGTTYLDITKAQFKVK